MELCLCWILKAAFHTKLFRYKRQRKFLRKHLGRINTVSYHIFCKKRIRSSVKRFQAYWIPTATFFIGVYSVFTLITGSFGQYMFPYGLAVILSLFLLKIVGQKHAVIRITKIGIFQRVIPVNGCRVVFQVGVDGVILFALSRPCYARLK